MPEQLPPRLIALQKKMQEFADGTLADLAASLCEGKVEKSGLRPQVVGASRAAGFFSLTQPEACGGQEASHLTLTALRDTLAACNNPLTRYVFGPAPGVLTGCAEPLKSEYLLPLLAGEKRSAFAFTEAGNAPHATRAELRGEDLIISGVKSYVTGGLEADFLNTLVQIGDQGPALVVIDCHAEGVQLTHQFETLDGEYHAEFEFSEVAVPRSHIIGKPGDGLNRALRQIGNERLSMAAEAVGTLRWVLDFLSGHLKAPHRSGEALAAREGVRLRYADLRIEAYAARSMVYRTARLADAGENVVNEAIASKVFATECLSRVVDGAIQLCGGKALTRGHPLEELYRRVRSGQLAEGANDVLRLNLARGALDLGKGRI